MPRPPVIPAQNGILTGTSYGVSNTSGNAVIAAGLQASGTAGFTMSGAGGMATLTAANSYTGDTNITGGTFVLDSSGTGASPAFGSLGTTNVSVSGGAALVVRGNSSIGTGNLSIAGSGALDLRDNSLNIFTVNGGLSLGSGTQGSGLYFELGTFGNDQVNVSGNAALSGTSTVNLSAVAGSSPSAGQYTLLVDQRRVAGGRAFNREKASARR